MTTKTFLLLILVALVVVYTVTTTVLGAYCHGEPKNKERNLNMILSQEPVFVRSVTNGKLFVVNQGTQYEMPIVHVYGTPYEQGYANGLLTKEKLLIFVPKVWNYMELQVQKGVEKLSIPAWLRHLIERYGLGLALDLTYEATRFFTGSYFYEELQGIADATGLDYIMLRRIHLVGEVTKGHCSMFGVWGDATKSTGKTIQLRAFDWATDGPFQSYPQVTIYHPKSQENGHAFANIGFAGWIGSFSGMSSTQLAVSEIGVAYPDETFGSESRIGIPFTFLMRDILQFDETLNDSIMRIKNAHRTCDLILGVGDGKFKTFRAFQYSSSVANVIADDNLLPKNDTWHPQIKDAVYYGMDWLCPPYSKKLAEQLQRFYGNITIENSITDIVALTSSGTTQVVLYDLTDNAAYISYAKPIDSGSGPLPAYLRPYTRLDMKKLFAEKL
jgi:isopenicillin-N N-acyltransferase-like protein